jgi:transposase
MASGGRDGRVVTCAPFALGEAPGAIVAGFDVHRRQITIDALDTATGEISRGQIESTPAAVERWVAGFPGRVIHVAVEACTGWLFVCRALERHGAIAHLAEPVETSALRGRKRRAKTDRADAKWLRQLLCEGRLPEAWAPPEHVRQWRSRARLRNTLVAERTSWTQRIRATLYHHGIAGAPDELRTLAGRQFLAGLELPIDASERITVALEIIDLLDAQLSELERNLRALARRQAGCQALMRQYGVGEISALVTLCELGDVTRLHASRQAVRMAGIDIGVHRSDRHAQLGKLTRQGSAPLRWALFEAAQSASHRTSPDYHDYHALKARGLSHTRARLTIARKLARRSYHILKELGPATLDPPDQRSDKAHPSPMRSKHAASSQPRSRHPRPAWRPTKDRAAAVAPPERPINHHVTGRHYPRPRAQIRQGVHGAKPRPSSRQLPPDHPCPAGDTLKPTHNLHHKHA